MHERGVGHRKRLKAPHADAQADDDDYIQQYTADRPANRGERRVFIPLERLGIREKSPQRLSAVDVTSSCMIVYNFPHISIFRKQKRKHKNTDRFDNEKVGVTPFCFACVCMRVRGQNDFRMRLIFAICAFMYLIMGYPSSESLYGRDKMTKYKVGIEPSIEDLTNYVITTKEPRARICALLIAANVCACAQIFRLARGTR